MSVTIGGEEWEVGQVVKVTLPNGSKRIGKITDIRKSNRTHEWVAYTSAGVNFIESDVRNNWVEAVA